MSRIPRWPPGPPRSDDLEAPQRHIQVVVDNHQILGGELEISHESRHRPAAQIHIRGGLRQDDAF